MFQVIDITELYRLEKRKPVRAIVAKFGSYSVSTGVTVAEYYNTLEFLQTAKKSRRRRVTVPWEFEPA